MSDLKAQKGRSHVQTSLLLPSHRDSTNVDNCSNDKKQEHSAVRRLLSRPNTTNLEPMLAHDKRRCRFWNRIDLKVIQCMILYIHTAR